MANLLKNGTNILAIGTGGSSNYSSVYDTLLIDNEKQTIDVKNKFIEKEGTGEQYEREFCRTHGGPDGQDHIWSSNVIPVTLDKVLDNYIRIIFYDRTELLGKHAHIKVSYDDNMHFEELNIMIGANELLPVVDYDRITGVELWPLDFDLNDIGSSFIVDIISASWTVVSEIQPKLTAGDGIAISNSNVISADTGIVCVNYQSIDGSSKIFGAIENGRPAMVYFVDTEYNPSDKVVHTLFRHTNYGGGNAEAMFIAYYPAEPGNLQSTNYVTSVITVTQHGEWSHQFAVR